eukprot:6145711-Amphidinium_carterae.1
MYWMLSCISNYFRQGPQGMELRFANPTAIGWKLFVISITEHSALGCDLHLLNLQLLLLRLFLIHLQCKSVILWDHLVWAITWTTAASEVATAKVLEGRTAAAAPATRAVAAAAWFSQHVLRVSFLAHLGHVESVRNKGNRWLNNYFFCVSDAWD